MLLIDELMPHMTLATVKPAADAVNKARVPSARERKPESGIATTSAIKYEVWTQGISSPEADNPAWISFSEAETIWMSRNDMNMAKHITTKATSRRGVSRSALPAPPNGDWAETGSAFMVVDELMTLASPPGSLPMRRIG